MHTNNNNNKQLLDVNIMFLKSDDNREKILNIYLNTFPSS